MGKLYEATIKWREGMKALKRRGATTPEKAAAREQVGKAFEEMVAAVQDDSSWDETDQRAWDYLERLDAAGQ